MTQEYINEGNVIIARFDTDDINVLERDLLKAGTIESMHYHSDWNWIHPVLQKLEQLGCCVWMEYILLYQCKIHLLKNKGIDKSITICEGTNEGNTPIQATFKAVVEFLKKYNELGYER